LIEEENKKEEGKKRKRKKRNQIYPPAEIILNQRLWLVRYTVACRSYCKIPVNC